MIEEHWNPLEDRGRFTRYDTGEGTVWICMDCETEADPYENECECTRDDDDGQPDDVKEHEDFAGDNDYSQWECDE